MRSLGADATLEQLSMVHENTPDLLESIGLNPVQYWDKTLKQVCFEKQWNESELLEWIRKNTPETIANGKSAKNVESYSGNSTATDICSMLSKQMHPRIREYAELVGSEFERVYALHAIQYPWLSEISWDLRKLLENLNRFLQFEERVFYPLTKEAEQYHEQMLDGSAQKLKRSLSLINDDHEQILGRATKIRRIGNLFKIEDGTCTTFRLLCRSMDELFDLICSLVTIEKTLLLPAVDRLLQE